MSIIEKINAMKEESVEEGDNEEFEKKATISSFNVMTAKVGTNCPQGGDEGHGGYTYFELGGTKTIFELDVDLIGLYGDRSGEEKSYSATELGVPEETRIKKIRIGVRGDTEAITLAKSLEWMASQLRGQLDRGNDSIDEGCFIEEE